MKTKSLLLFMLMALFAPWAANAQTTVTIGEGTATSNTNPIGTYYNYSITEQLYTADEIGMAGTISSISFYYMGIAAKDLPITVYMQNVDAEDLTSGISLADADEVFSGTLPVTTTAGWVTINLDTPFAYDGTSSLLIGCIKDYLYYFSGQSWQGTATTTTMARYTQSDSAGPYTTSTVPSSTQANRPNIQMVITPGSGPVCDKPETFEVSNVTTNSATLTWTGGSGNYNVEYKGGSVADWTAYLTNTTATTANLTGLTPGTAYQYRVQSVCGSDVSGWKSVNFSTLLGIPLVEGFGTAIPSGWSIYSGLVETVLAGGDLTTASYGWSFGSNNGVFDNHARVNIYGTSCNYWLVLPTLAMEDNVQLMFDVAYTAYSGTGAPAQTGDDDKFVVLVNNGRTWEIVRQWDNAGSEYVLNDLNTTPITVAIDLSNYAEAGQPITVAFYGESTVSNADNNLHIDNVSIDYIPACAKPTGLAVNYEGGNTATVTWEGEASTYNIDVNGNVITGTSPYTLSDLELATTYEVEVQANCGSDLSEWAGPVSFTTDACMPEDQIVVNYTLTDSYSDGWNGNYILVVDENCNIVNQLTIESGNSATGTLKVCGSYVQFLWYAGSYPTETSWVFTDNAGNVLFEGAGSADMATLDVLYTIDNNPYSAPADVAASEVGPRSAKLSWTETGTATAWQIKLTAGDDEEGTIIDANSNPFVITGLTPETEYFAQVRATGANGTSIWTCLGADFTTLESCPAPTALEVVPTPISATVTWTGYASNYILRYGTCAEPDPTQPATIVFHADDVWQDGSGYQMLLDADATAFGTIIPETGGLTSAGDATDDVYAEFEYKIPANADGSCTTSNVVIDNTITLQIPAGTYDWCITNPTPGDRIWIASGQGNIGGRADDYVFEGGMTYEFHMYLLGSNDATDVTIMCSNVDWTYVDNATSPYTINGLDPETEYTVGVQAVCGGEDGESAWTSTNFTTPSNCDAPSALNVTNLLPTTATLNWTGYQEEGFEVRYRPTAEGSELLNEDFENGLTWTTIDADGDGFNWDLHVNTGTGNHATHSGDGVMTSASYDNDASVPLTPDNYLVSPRIELGGSITFWACAQDGAWPTEHFGVAVSTTSNTDASTFTTIQEWTMTAKKSASDCKSIYDNGNYLKKNRGNRAEGAWYSYTVDLSAYAGQAGYVAIRHFNCTDMFYLNVDDITINGPAPEEQEWIMASTDATSYAAEGLEPETAYEWQVRGVNNSCTNGEDEGYTAWSEMGNFTTPEITTLTQTITLEEASTWFSTYVDITLDDLKAALVAALPANTTIKIKNADEILTYSRGRWNGSLTWDVAKMYKIIVPTTVTLPIEFTLEGMPLDPSEHSITIAGSGRATWIGFPFSENMTPTNAFAEIAQNGDKVKSSSGNTSYTRGRWQGEFPLEPGMGYIFISNANATDRTLVYPTSSKAVKK